MYTDIMNYELRVVVFSEEVLQIRKVYLDDQGNPIRIDPEGIDLSAKSMEELVATVLHASASLTKPALDVNMFVRHDVNDAARIAAAILRGDSVR
jgi:hypothetical protein